MGQMKDRNNKQKEQIMNLEQIKQAAFSDEMKKISSMSQEEYESYANDFVKKYNQQSKMVKLPFKAILSGEPGKRVVEINKLKKRFLRSPTVESSVRYSLVENSGKDKKQNINDSMLLKRI